MGVGPGLRPARFTPGGEPVQLLCWMIAQIGIKVLDDSIRIALRPPRRSKHAQAAQCDAPNARLPSALQDRPPVFSLQQAHQ